MAKKKATPGATRAMNIHRTHGVSLKKAWQIVKGKGSLPKSKRKGK
jgi:hypothetical protein